MLQNYEFIRVNENNLFDILLIAQRFCHFPSIYNFKYSLLITKKKILSANEFNHTILINIRLNLKAIQFISALGPSTKSIQLLRT